LISAIFSFANEGSDKLNFLHILGMKEVVFKYL
jgi:hypothetical protein